MTATAPQLKTLKDMVKLVAHIFSDSLQAIGDSGAQRLTDFANILPDLMVLLPELGALSLNSLSPEDYMALVVELAADLKIADAHASLIVKTSLDLVVAALPKIEALIAAIKATPTTPIPAVPAK